MSNGNNSHDVGHIGPICLPLDWDSLPVRDCQLDLFEKNGSRYLTAQLGELSKNEECLLRVQSACALADIFQSRWCDCHWQLAESKRRIFTHGNGLLIYCYDQHGKGIGLRDHYRIYAVGQALKQELLTETFDHLGLPYDNRSYADVITILRDIGITKIRLLTNDPCRIKVFEDAGFQVTRESLIPPFDEFNQTELEIKIRAFGHMIPPPP